MADQRALRSLDPGVTFLNHGSFGVVTWGGVLGLLASLALGVAVGVLSGPLVELGPDLIGLFVIVGAVVVLM